MIAEGLTVGREYFVNFKLFPYKTPDDWTNVLHFTTGKNIGTLGSRIPAIFVTDGKILVNSYIHGHASYGFIFRTKSLANTTIDIKIQQVLVDEKYYLELIVNNESKHQIVNTKPQVFENVKLYVSDPWHKALPGYITSLQYSAG